MNNEQDVLTILASDMDSQGMKNITPDQLRELSHATKAQHIINDSNFSEVTTIEDFE